VSDRRAAYRRAPHGTAAQSRNVCRRGSRPDLGLALPTPQLTQGLAWCGFHRGARSEGRDSTRSSDSQCDPYSEQGQAERVLGGRDLGASGGFAGPAPIERRSASGLADHSSDGQGRPLTPIP
jgi:hypothetical protein